MPPFLKNIVHDLIEKRLWPVALLLVVALVAVPVLLGGGSAAAPASDSAAVAGGTGTGGQSAVSLDTAAGQERAYERSGKVRNPFKQPKGAATPTPTAPGTNPAGDAAGPVPVCAA